MTPSAMVTPFPKFETKLNIIVCVLSYIFPLNIDVTPEKVGFGIFSITI